MRDIGLGMADRIVICHWFIASLTRIYCSLGLCTRLRSKRYLEHDRGNTSSYRLGLHVPMCISLVLELSSGGGVF